MRFELLRLKLSLLFHRSWLPPTLVGFGLVVLLFWGLGATPLTDIDEGAFAEASREMLARGDWVSPWLLDAPRFDKPVLIHWLQMVSMTIFGINAWGARIPSAIAGLVWILAIASWAYAIAKPENKQRAAVWTLLIAGTSLGIPAMARASTADALLNALIALSLLSLWMAFFKAQSEASIRFWGRATAALVGLGLLTKGPIAILVPGVASAIGALAIGKREGWPRLKTLVSDPLAWGLLIAIPMPWYWLQYQAQGQPFIDNFFGTHNIGRFTSTMHGFSSGPWFYPAWLLIALLPWVPLAIATLIRFIKNPRADASLAMCGGIFLFVIVFFSFSATKLPHYGFYGLAGLITLMGLRFSDPNDSEQKLLVPLQRLWLTLILLGLALLPQWWPTIAATIREPYFRAVADDVTEVLVNQMGWAWFAIPAAIGMATLFIRKAWAIGAAAWCFTVFVHLVFVPVVINSFRGPIQEAANFVRASKESVVSWRLSAPSLSFESDRIIASRDPEIDQVAIIYAKDRELLQSKLEQSTGKQIGFDTLWQKTGIQIIKVRQIVR